MFLALTRQFNYITTSAFYYTPITTSLGNQLIPWGARVALRWELSPPTKAVGSGSSPGFDVIWELSSRRVSCTLTCDQVSFFPFLFWRRGKKYIYFTRCLPVVQNLDFCLIDRKKKDPLELCTGWLSNISDFQSYYIGFVTFASSWQKPQDDRGIRHSKLRF